MAGSDKALNSFMRFFEAEDRIKLLDVVNADLAVLKSPDMATVASLAVSRARRNGDFDYLAHALVCQEFFHRLQQNDPASILTDYVDPTSVQTAVSKFLSARSAAETKSICERYLRTLSSGEVIAAIGEFVESLSDDRQKEAFGYRKLLLQRMREDGFGRAFEWAGLVDLVFKAGTQGSLEKALPIVEKSLDQFLSDAMGQVFDDLERLYAKNASSVFYLSGVKRTIIAACRRNRRRTALVPHWLISKDLPGDIERLSTAIKTANSSDEIIKAIVNDPKLATSVFERMAASGKFSVAAGDEDEGAGDLGQEQEEGTGGDDDGSSPREPIDQYRLMLSEVAKVGGTEIEGVLREAATFGSGPGADAPVHYDRGLMILEPWLSDLGLSQVHLDLARSLQGDTRSILEEIRCYNRDLEGLVLQDNPERWHTLHRGLASLYACFTGGERRDVFRRAEEHCRHALQARRLLKNPVTWASAHALHGEIKLGAMGRDTPSASAQKLAAIRQDRIGRMESYLVQSYAQHRNADGAIGSFEHALLVFNKNDHPAAWAAAQVGLATALTLRWRGDRGRNQREAQARFAAAIDVMSRLDDPHLVTAAHARFGFCLHHSGLAEAARHARQHLTTATRVWTFARYPTRFATIADALATVAFETADWGQVVQSASIAIKSADLLAKRRDSDSETRRDMEASCRLANMCAYALARLERFDESLIYATYASQAPLGRQMPESVTALLGNVPEGTMVVVPIVTSRGSVLIVLSAGLTHVGNEHIVDLPSLTDAALGEMLVGDDVIGEETKHIGWLKALARFYESVSARSLAQLSEPMSRAQHQLASHLHRLVDLLPQGGSVAFVPKNAVGLLPIYPALTELFDDRTVVRLTPSLHKGRSARPRATVSVAEKSALLVRPDASLALPLSTIEIASISQRLPDCDILQGAAATPTKVLEQLQSARYRVVHFACHGVMQWNDPFGSLLKLTGGDLPIAALAETDALSNTELVTLSACDVGLPHFQHQADVFVGATSYLIDAGARYVVASTVPAADDAATYLMARFYELLPERGPGRALRDAQSWLRTRKRRELVEYALASLRSPSQGEILGHAIKFGLKGNSEDLPFDSVVYWGGFACTGAL